MNKNRTNFNHRVRWMCGIGLCLVAATAWGGIVPPLYVGNLEPVLDEYGRTMAGSLSAESSDTRSLVELRTVTEQGLILPILPNGDSHPWNPLISSGGIGGIGLNSSSPDSGLFCLILSERPAAGTQIFARVYNAPTAAEASFYADSALMEVPRIGKSLVVSFSTNATAIDPGDDDGDGLNNSWEQVMGTDGVLTNDFDGDGMSDLHEMLAGTDATDAESNLSFQFIRRDPPLLTSGAGDDEVLETKVRVRWQSIPGRTYRLYHVPMLLAQDPATGEPYEFELQAELVAQDGEFEIEMLVDVPEGSDTGMFRVCVVEE